MRRKMLSEAGEYMLDPNEYDDLYETATTSAEDYEFDPVPWEELEDIDGIIEEYSKDEFDVLDNEEAVSSASRPIPQWDITIEELNGKNKGKLYIGAICLTPGVLTSCLTPYEEEAEKARIVKKLEATKMFFNENIQKKIEQLNSLFKNNIEAFKNNECSFAEVQVKLTDELHQIQEALNELEKQLDNKAKS